jgi:hypothetical protein
MDLSTFSTEKLSEEGAVLYVVDPRTEEPFADGTSITLSGVDGAKYRDFQHRIQNRRYKSIGRGKTKIDLDAAELEQEGLELLAACTLSWTGIDWDGAPLPCTPDNAKMLYTKSGWLREQVDAFIGNRQNFFPKPASSSSSTTAPL